MSIYTHLDEQFKKKSISKLDKYLDKAMGVSMGVKEEKNA